MAESESITVQDLLNLGHVKKSFSNNKKVCTLKWNLSNLLGIGEVWGADNRSFSFLRKEKSEEVAKRNAYKKLEEELSNELRTYNEYYKDMILEIKQYKEGKPQDKIKILGNHDSWYSARFYVGGSPHYIEVFTAAMHEECNHFIVEYENRTYRLWIKDEVTEEYKEKAIYCQREIAHQSILDKIKKDVKDSMSFHGMEEANKVQFELV